MFKEVTISDIRVGKEDIGSFSTFMKKHINILNIFYSPTELGTITFRFLESEDPNDIEKKIIECYQKWSTREKTSREDTYTTLSTCCTPKNHKNIADELIEKKWISFLREHDISLSSHIIKLMEFFDESFKMFFYEVLQKNEMSVVEKQYTTIIPTYYLEKLNYFSNDPTGLMIATHLNNDYSIVEDFKNSIAIEGLSQDIRPFIDKKITYTLQSAPCLKVYFEHENKEINNNTVFTVKGLCYRNERKNLHFLERLINFNMREFVFIGDKKFITEMSVKSVEWSIEWLKLMGISASSVVADDPFFIAKNQVDKFDMPEVIKQEIRAEIPHKSDTISIASFDNHGDYFTKTFNITMNNNKESWTGCIGLGLERCVWSFLQQYGTDPADWPKNIVGYK